MEPTKHIGVWIALALLAIFIIVVIVLAMLRSSSTQTQQISTNTQTSPAYNNSSSVGADQSNLAASSTMVTSVATFNGGTIQTKDFLSGPDAQQDPVNPGYYELGNNETAGAYSIVYIAKGQYFNITLLQKPIGPARVNAEKYLMDLLGISSAAICVLKYSVTVPVSVDPKHAGVDLGFSFCPTAVPLGN